MSRLTFNENGEWGLKGYDIKQVPEKVYGAVCKLKDYEKVCDSPAKLEELDRLYLEKCEEVNRLQAELEKYKPSQPVERKNKYEITRELTVKIICIGKVQNEEDIMSKERAEELMVKFMKEQDMTAHVTVEDIKDFIRKIPNAEA